VKAIEFSLAARTELHAAADRYEREYRGRGHRFYDAVERALKVIAALPTSAPLWPGVPESLAVRRRLVPGFPFALAFRERGETVRIEAVAHTRRRPGYWRRRLAP